MISSVIDCNNVIITRLNWTRNVYQPAKFVYCYGRSNHMQLIAITILVKYYYGGCLDIRRYLCSSRYSESETNRNLPVNCHQSALTLKRLLEQASVGTRNARIQGLSSTNLGIFLSYVVIWHNTTYMTQQQQQHNNMTQHNFCTLTQKLFVKTK